MKQIQIMQNNLLRGFEQYQDEFEEEIISAMRSGWYILGERLRKFEDSFAGFLHSSNCVGLASGLDALWIAFRMLGIGGTDEVIVQANTYIASVMGITVNGAVPVFVEPDEYYGISADGIEEKITERTKAVLAVHLYGMPCEMDKIQNICKKHGLLLVEDCAQSHGAAFQGQYTGTFGDAGCFSFYPTKNLGAFGDGGCVVTDSDALAEKLRIFRNYGSQQRYQNVTVGANSRLDEIQAGLLNVRLRHIEAITAERQSIARRYGHGIRNKKFVLPRTRPDSTCVWHQYVIRTEDKQMRERLILYLKEKGIGTLVHYPVPPHLSQAYAYLGCRKGEFPVTEHYADTVLSLPVYQGYTEEEQEYVINALNGF